MKSHKWGISAGGDGPDASARPVLWPRAEPRVATAWHQLQVGPLSSGGRVETQPERTNPVGGVRKIRRIQPLCQVEFGLLESGVKYRVSWVETCSHFFRVTVIGQITLCK